MTGLLFSNCDKNVTISEYEAFEADTHQINQLRHELKLVSFSDS